MGGKLNKDTCKICLQEFWYLQHPGWAKRQIQRLWNGSRFRRWPWGRELQQVHTSHSILIGWFICRDGYFLFCRPLSATWAPNANVPPSNYEQRGQLYKNVLFFFFHDWPLAASPPQTTPCRWDTPFGTCSSWGRPACQRWCGKGGPLWPGDVTVCWKKKKSPQQMS